MNKLKVCITHKRDLLDEFSSRSIKPNKKFKFQILKFMLYSFEILQHILDDTEIFFFELMVKLNIDQSKGVKQGVVVQLQL